MLGRFCAHQGRHPAPPSEPVGLAEIRATDRPPWPKGKAAPAPTLAPTLPPSLAAPRRRLQGGPAARAARLRSPQDRQNLPSDGDAEAAVRRRSGLPLRGRVSLGLSRPPPAVRGRGRRAAGPRSRQLDLTRTRAPSSRPSSQLRAPGSKLCAPRGPALGAAWAGRMSRPFSSRDRGCCK